MPHSGSDQAVQETAPVSAFPLVEIAAEKNSRQRKLAWDLALLEMDYPSCAKALEELSRQPRQARIDMLMSAAWRRLGELDGPRALKETDALPTAAGRRQAQQAALLGWAIADSGAAWRWLAQQAGSAPTNSSSPFRTVRRRD